MGKPNARDRILETASRLFHQRGYSEVGINEIIKSSETAKATFYHHFPAKSELCQAWLRTIHDHSEESRKNILESDACPIQKVGDYFDALLNFLNQSEFRGCPYTNTAMALDEGEKEIHEEIVGHKQSIRDFFRQLSSSIITDSREADTLGDTLFLLYSGATTEAQNLQDLWPVEAAKKAAISLCEGKK